MTHPPDGALRLPHAEARASVIKRLQATASRYSPGTEEFERADLAASLALSPDRGAAVAPFLMRNVKRDARRILLHQPHHEVLFTDLEQGAVAASAAGECKQTLEDLLPASRYAGPDEEAVANDLEEKVRRAVKVLPDGEECLDAMLVSETPDDTAARLGVPLHRVHRTRAYIRWRAERALA
jgi:hypothetical protein